LVNSDTTSTTYTYTYTSTNNRLASESTGGLSSLYKYDLAGSLVSGKTGKGKTAQLRSFAYNADERLATAGPASLTYDGFGQRVAETAAGGGEHFIFGSDGSLLAEHNAQGTLIRNYVYLNGQPLAIVDGAGNVSSILNDQVGQPRIMLNASDAVTWQRVAGIFGDTVSQLAGDTAANPLRFPGQWADDNTGLRYNYFRDYDPGTGRYIETDPIDLRAGPNPYVYAGNSPTKWIDPFGLCKEDDCKKLEQKIDKVRNELAKRSDDLRRDPLSLPPSGPMSVAGHQQQFQNKQAQLRSLLNDYNKQGCGGGLPADVWTLATMPTPSASTSNKSFMDTMSKITGLTGGALVAYVIVSEGSRLFPPRDLVPIP
jgi:RHS repeat-associated protein